MPYLFKILPLFIFLFCFDSVFSQSYAPPEFHGSKSEFMSESFGSDSCGISSGFFYRNSLRKEIKNVVLSFDWHIYGSSMSISKKMYNEKFEKLYKHALQRISNISNYDILKLNVLKGGKVIHTIERNIEIKP